ncbi:GNAT family N-acetyltransferase [Methylomagnum ishizawai]|uniref:GNAT family N-acetyltransferase n=1 Tax=Methylomagnum ishizawai TaxID=1760988 RepID=UPI001C340258|nr:GNAT family N-acetyltransferase [Methylomagnum ishizawai]BBL76913.1 acetyltransferase [Methylomagnum ishizawai]
MRKIEVLDRHHRRGDFDCGVPALNEYLAKIAQQHNQKGLSKTFAMVDEAIPESIIGFFTLASCEINRNLLPEEIAKKMPIHGLPAVKLARLAVAKSHQNKGVGKVLLIEAFTRAHLVYDIVGAVALFVDAKDDNAALFYQRHGFIPLRSHPLQLYIPFGSLSEVLSNQTI